MNKLPPYAKQMAIPSDNTTVYVFVDWHSYKSANQITQARGMVFLPLDDPGQYSWPVRGCGVIIMDYLGIGGQSMVIGALTSELTQQGADAVHYVDFVGDSITKNVG